MNLSLSTYNCTTSISGFVFLAPPMHAPAPAGGVQRFGNSHTDHCLLFSIPWMYTFSAKEKDSETGFSYFGSRYYNSDLSIWLSVDPMASKYPSLSPYVYCANNPVKLVDPEGEEFEEGKPPGKISSFFNNLDRKVVGSSENRKGEGHSDGANQGTNTKQDVEVGVAVVTAMISVGTAFEAELAFEVTVSAVSAANSIDDATVNPDGQTVSQRLSSNNPAANKAVNVTKNMISAVSALYSGSHVMKTATNIIKHGSRVLKEEGSEFVTNVATTTSSVRSFVKSIFKEK